jgi:hypothetical protein
MSAVAPQLNPTSQMVGAVEVAAKFFADAE